MTQRSNIVATETCSLCHSTVELLNRGRYGDFVDVRCPCCGSFRITGTAVDVLAHWDLEEVQWAAIAYAVKKMTGRSQPPRIDVEVLRALRDTATLPHADQIVDEFVIWVGSQSRWPGDSFDVTYANHHTLLGAVTEGAFNYMIEAIERSGLFVGTINKALNTSHQWRDCALAAVGWQRFRELSTAKEARRYGFAAMKYGDAEVDAIFRDHFAPQVARTGFDLRRLDDGQPAGLIDDQLRLRIRQARFLVCDLTHGNRGAYWEAGFAEGLGIPVIYTCRRDVFEDPRHPFHPHFDAAHWVTVPWDAVSPTAAAEKLKTTVRATLPTEARLED